MNENKNLVIDLKEISILLVDMKIHKIKKKKINILKLTFRER